MSDVSAGAGQPASTTATSVGAPQRYLTFVLSGDVYALGIFNITEIIECRSLTVVPMMPEFIRGVINLRGRVVPVVDMAARFGHGSTTIARRTSIIIVDTSGLASTTGGEEGGHEIGIMVDAVNEVVELESEDVEPPPTFGSGIRADFIAGMAKRDDDFVIILDVGHVLSLDEMVVLGQAARAAQESAIAQQGFAVQGGADAASVGSPERVPEPRAPALEGTPESATGRSPSASEGRKTGGRPGSTSTGRRGGGRSPSPSGAR